MSETDFGFSTLVDIDDRSQWPALQAAAEQLGLDWLDVAAHLQGAAQHNAEIITLEESELAALKDFFGPFGLTVANIISISGFKDPRSEDE